MIMGNVFSSREVVSPIKVIIWNKELLMGLRCVSESRTTSICKSCSCLLSSQRCLQMSFALHAITLLVLLKSQSQRYFATGGLPQISSSWHGPHRRHHGQQFLYCYVRIRCRRDVFIGRYLATAVSSGFTTLVFRAAMTQYEFRT
jgi:hypothetical protein